MMQKLNDNACNLTSLANIDEVSTARSCDRLEMEFCYVNQLCSASYLYASKNVFMNLKLPSFLILKVINVIIIYYLIIHYLYVYYL